MGEGTEVELGTGADMEGGASGRFRRGATQVVAAGDLKGDAVTVLAAIGPTTARATSAKSWAPGPRCRRRWRTRAMSREGCTGPVNFRKTRPSGSVALRALLGSTVIPRPIAVRDLAVESWPQRWLIRGSKSWSPQKCWICRVRVEASPSRMKFSSLSDSNVRVSALASRWLLLMATHSGSL